MQNCTCFIQLIVISLLFCFVTKMKMYFYFCNCKMNVMADCKSIKLHSRHLRVIEVKKRSCSKQYWLWHRQFEWVLYLLSLYFFFMSETKKSACIHTLYHQSLAFTQLEPFTFRLVTLYSLNLTHFFYCTVYWLIVDFCLHLMYMGCSFIRCK